MDTNNAPRLFYPHIDILGEGGRLDATVADNRPALPDPVASPLDVVHIPARQRNVKLKLRTADHHLYPISPLTFSSPFRDDRQHSRRQPLEAKRSTPVYVIKPNHSKAKLAKQGETSDMFSCLIE